MGTRIKPFEINVLERGEDYVSTGIWRKQTFLAIETYYPRADNSEHTIIVSGGREYIVGVTYDQFKAVFKLTQG